MFGPLSLRLRKVWKRLCICENEATIDYYHGFALKLINTWRRSFTQRLVSWFSPVVPKVWIKIQRTVEKGQKMGRAEAFQTGVADFQRYHQGRRNSGGAGGTVKELEQWNLVKNKIIVINYACFCTATTLTSKIIAEIIENHSEFCGYTNSCTKFVSSWSWSTIKLPITVSWKSTSAHVAPLLKEQRSITRYFTALQRSWYYLWCCYVRAPVPPLPPLSQVRGSTPSCTSVSASSVTTACLSVA